MSKPKSESGPVLNWSSPDQNSDFYKICKSEHREKLCVQQYGILLQQTN